MEVKIARLNNSEIPSDLIYVEKALVVLNSDDVVMWSGSAAEFAVDSFIATGYYDKCTLKARSHDLYLNNNTKVGA